MNPQANQWQHGEPTRHPMALAMPTHFKNEIHAASRLRNSFFKTLKESIWRSYSHDSLLGAFLTFSVL